MRAAAADHFGAPYAICRHPDPDQPSAKRTMTVGAVLIDLDARVMHVANGPPCTNDYVAFKVDGRINPANKPRLRLCRGLLPSS